MPAIWCRGQVWVLKLFNEEAPFTEPIEGVSSFAATFAERGPRDRRGRSLRDFDLKTRLFRYPLSYMIYSDGFDDLPEPTRLEIYRRLYAILTAAEKSARYAHLSADDKKAILEIAAETKTNLPPEWR